MKSRVLNIAFTVALILSGGAAFSQLSPGDLSEPHSGLEGLTNCTKCHVLGNRISGEKCLLCHTEIQQRIAAQKGYHSSAEVKGKECFTCHTEHNGKNYKLVRLDETKYDHSLTGYQLSVPHSQQGCRECHNTGHITDPSIRSKKSTYLGLSTECLTCHEDYHRQTLAASCLSCHDPDAFRPATKFDHSGARFRLEGKHKGVECISCHKIELVNGKKFQEFRGVVFTSCASCHKDPHQNKFGPNCRQCHTEESFLTLKTVSNFDHNKTNFRLEGKHINVTCNTCHKTKVTDPLKYDHCTDCHPDYHQGQFKKNGVSPDCIQCHSVKGFNTFSYNIDQHNLGSFPLNGAHAATACFECHRKQEKWSFRGIGIECRDCHPDKHEGFIQSKYYPGGTCKSCHKETRWRDVSFDHSRTGFSLTGAHNGQGCGECHYRKDSKGVVIQKFAGLPGACTACHTDNHFGQFAVNGVTDCTRCHTSQDWKATRFDHNKSAFRLDGEHLNVPCSKCHKPQKEGSVFYVTYRIKEFKCESCH